MTPTAAPACSHCGDAMPPAKSTGRPRRYCSPRCRDDAYRDRQSRQVWDIADDADPVDDVALRELTVEAVAAELDHREAKTTPEDKLVRAVIETQVLAGQYRSLANQVRPELGWRAEAMSQDMRQSLTRLFGEETAQ